MGFRTGIVGLPNVGKSTLFNALTRTAMAQAANYPFCTIEPNVGEVAVPDPRLHAVAKIAGSRQVTPARMTFVDIAGLVKGASVGEGLGNQFLANIREMDAIAHVARCFDDGDVIHVSDDLDPVGDIEIVETELMLADVWALERRREKLVRKLKSGDRDAVMQESLIERALDALNRGVPARNMEVQPLEASTWKGLGLLTSMPVLYVCNVDEDSFPRGNLLSEAVAEFAGRNNAAHVVCSAALEAQIAILDADEAEEFMEALGIEESGLDRVIRAGYELLGLQTFFTAGPKEARAWTIPRGTSAQDAAGRIHNDFKRGFIRSETVSFRDYVEFGGESGARDAGKLRSEGKDYMVADGDVSHFLFNV